MLEVLKGGGFPVAMARIWTAMVVISIVAGIINGRIEEVSRAAMDGAAAAVQLAISMAGALCLWSGISEVMARSGLSNKLRRLLRPVLRRLLSTAGKDAEIMGAVSENVTANLLGLGNAATPPGVRAVTLMANHPIRDKMADDLCMFVVLNTASFQLLPTTAASLRAGYGASSPFDILPAVWVASAVSILVGMIAVKLMSRMSGKKVL